MIFAQIYATIIYVAIKLYYVINPIKIIIDRNYGADRRWQSSQIRWTMPLEITLTTS